LHNPRVIISGGGTGGHIFPAIAIANALKQLNQNIEILFVGAKGRMEMDKIPAAGYKIVGLPISGFQRRLSLKNLMFPIKVLKSLSQANKIIKQFKPDVAVGVGGYASGPTLFAAANRNIPTLIQEQNSYAGITNKILGRRASKICVAYEGMDKFFPNDKIILTGNPVRQDILNLTGKKLRGLEHFQLEEYKKTILVLGGSLGALTINEAVSDMLPNLAENNIQLVWQTGKHYYEKAKLATQHYEAQGIFAHDFIQRMDLAYAIADVVISRAGASTVSELCLVQKPAILIPSPNVAEDHQTKNATALVTRNAALMVTDAEAKQKLMDVLLSLINDDLQCEKLSVNIGKLAIQDSARIIASEVINLIIRKN
jgi:UDP-N-acetylglucosamine--N-acetylmuramyl-(pentapeptide) pyrophosphoryl-undecaprenol N-acetylglucosamine transferase